MKKLTILTDMDGICVNMLGYALQRIHTDHPHLSHIGMPQVTDYHLNRVFGQDINWEAYFQEPGFFRHPLPIPGAIDTLKALHDQGHRIVVVTSPGEFTGCVPDKDWWISKYMPFINYRDRIFTGSKHFVHGDVMIDDSPSILKSFLSSGNPTKLATIVYPYSNPEQFPLLGCVAKDWSCPEVAWAIIRQYIETLARTNA